MRLSRSPVAALALLLPLLGGCPEVAGPAADQQVGVVDSEYLDVPVLVAPDTVQAGVRFGVTVTTLGYSGCWKAAGAATAQNGAVVTITPYDRVLQGAACTAALEQLSRTVELRLDEPGVVVVRVEGRTDRPGREGEIARVEKPVVVR